MWFSLPGLAGLQKEDDVDQIQRISIRKFPGITMEAEEKELP